MSLLCHFFLFHDSSLTSLKLSVFFLFIINLMYRLTQPSDKILSFPLQCENIKRLAFFIY